MQNETKEKEFPFEKELLAVSATSGVSYGDLIFWGWCNRQARIDTVYAQNPGLEQTLKEIAEGKEKEPCF